MKPTVKERNDPIGGVEYEHPAFGQIRASRVSGGAGVLYDSDFNHQHFITVEITGSTLTRNLSNDWIHGRDQKIEIAMTEAQWATFVSSLNFGSGTPCTIQRFNREKIPDIEWETTKHEMFQSEFEDRMSNAVEVLDLLSEALDNWQMSKKARNNLKGMVSTVRAEIGSNRKFTEDQFAEFMEVTVERAKQEIHGHVQAVAMQTGVETLKLTKEPEQ